MSKNKHNLTDFTDENLKADLLEWLPRGASVYTRVEYIVPGPNGTGVNVVPLVMDPKSPGPRNITWHLLNLGFGKRPTNSNSWGSVRMNGIGLGLALDHKLVMDLSTYLYGDPYVLRQWTY